MSFRKYRLGKVLLDKYLKSRVSDDPYTDNKENGSKHCCNLKDSTFTISLNHCEASCIGKNFL